MMAERKLIKHPRCPKASPCTGTLIIIPYASSVYCASGLVQCSPGGETLAILLLPGLVQCSPGRETPTILLYRHVTVKIKILI